MKSLSNAIVAGALLFPALAVAATQTTRCYAGHFVRATGPAIPDPGGVAPTELRSTVVFFNNGNLEHSAVVERLTVRSSTGVVLHDSGPKIGVPHPPNLGVDITTIPPGGTFGFGTATLFGTGNPPGGPAAGSGMSITVEMTTPGRPRLVVVHARENSRQLVSTGDPAMPGPLMQGPERSANASRCFRIRDRDDD